MLKPLIKEMGDIVSETKTFVEEVDKWNREVHTRYDTMKTIATRLQLLEDKITALNDEIEKRDHLPIQDFGAEFAVMLKDIGMYNEP
jgi:predicted nuclease with TOPRIM domain